MRIPFTLILTIAFLVNAVCPFSASAAPLVLPVPGTMVEVSPALESPVFKGIKVYPDNPFKFEFVMSGASSSPDNVIPANAGIQQQEQLKQESTKLVKYFLAALTTAEKDMWVNLSPYEKNRIVPESFGQTEMGRDLLAQDYLLKQLTASLVYPEGEVGKEFWRRIYQESANKNIPVNTFNKVWIVPNKAVVYENSKNGTAYVVESSLKVMTEQDYLAASVIASEAKQSQIATMPSASRDDASKAVRDIVIPQLTKEVNEGANFAHLRQVYNSLILATWYKKKLKNSILNQAYADKNKVDGLSYEQVNTEAIYARYLEAFKKGAYNYIKEEHDPISNQIVPRKYFSGGMQIGVDKAMTVQEVLHADVLQLVKGLKLVEVDLRTSSAKKIDAMIKAIHFVNPQENISQNENAVLNIEIDFLRDVVKKLIKQQLDEGVSKDNNNGISVENISDTDAHRTFLVTWGDQKFILKRSKEDKDHSRWFIANHLRILRTLNREGRFPYIPKVILNGEGYVASKDIKSSYFVTSFLDGRDMDWQVENKYFIDDMHVAIFGVALVNLVSYIHSKGIIVRDLMPKNILVKSTGQPLLFDFDTSMPLDYDWDEPEKKLKGAYFGDFFTDYGWTLFKPDVKTDIFGIGMNLYYAATGKRYKRGESSVMDVKNEQLRLAIKYAIAPREERFETMAQLKEYLQRVYDSAMSLQAFPYANLQSATFWWGEADKAYFNKGPQFNMPNEANILAIGETPYFMKKAEDQARLPLIFAGYGHKVTLYQPDRRAYSDWQYNLNDPTLLPLKNNITLKDKPYMTTDVVPNSVDVVIMRSVASDSRIDKGVEDRRQLFRNVFNALKDEGVLLLGWYPDHSGDTRRTETMVTWAKRQGYVFEEIVPQYTNGRHQEVVYKIKKPARGFKPKLSMGDYIYAIRSAVARGFTNRAVQHDAPDTPQGLGTHHHNEKNFVRGLGKSARFFLSDTEWDDMDRDKAMSAVLQDPLLARVSSSKGAPNYGDFTEIFAAWMEELVASSRGIKYPTFLIGGDMGAGKTTMARFFKRYLEEHGHAANIVYTDDFVNNRAFRFQLLKHSLMSDVFFIDSKKKLDFMKKMFKDSSYPHQNRFWEQFKSLESSTGDVRLDLPNNQVVVHPGEIIIIEGPFTKSLFPELVSTKSVLFQIDPKVQSWRITKRIMDAKGDPWLYASLKANLPYQRNLHRLVTEHGETYDYFVNIDSNGVLTMSHMEASEDRAMKGGIDFNADKMTMDVQNDGKGIAFNADPALLREIQQSPGLTPAIISIQPLNDLKSFLGINL